MSPPPFPPATELPEETISYLQLGLTLRGVDLRAIGYPSEIVSPRTAVKWRYSAQRPAYHVAVQHDLHLLLALPPGRLAVVDSDFTAAEGGGHLGMVQAWLFDLQNSTSSELRPGLVILSELQRRIANCSAREESGAQLPPLPPPSPAEPLGFPILVLPELNECPLLAANATVVAVNDETPPSPPTTPPPPLPPQHPPSPAMPPNLQCFFTECGVITDEEVVAAEAAAIQSRAARTAAPALVGASALAFVSSAALGHRDRR